MAGPINQKLLKVEEVKFFSLHFQFFIKFYWIVRQREWQIEKYFTKKRLFFQFFNEMLGIIAVWSGNK